MKDRFPLALALDTASVVLFVAVGRRNHDEETGLAGVFATAAPFLIGLAAGWAIAWFVVSAGRRPTSIRTGLVIWPTTVAIGMLLRRTVFQDGTATSFVVVATVVLGTLLVGWRVVAVAWGRRSGVVGGMAERA